MSDDIRERARRGAALLDERLPGWADEIDRRRLALGDCEMCILGQLYGHYVDGADELGLLVDEGETSSGLGFLGGSDPSDIAAEYEALTAAWIAEVSARRRVLEAVR